MPYLKIQTNIAVATDKSENLIKRVSSAVARNLGKPESYVMVVLEPDARLLFAGTAEPAAYLELKSIGLPEDATGDLSAKLCALISEELGIAHNRTYIEFANAERHMWGFNGGTF